MKIDFGSQIPIYLQISQSIEDDIIRDIFEEETQIPSTTEVSISYNINPATIAKGFNLLVDEGILYKKRGVGMFVAKNAKNTLIKKQKEHFYEKYVVNLLHEADKLGITIEDIIKMITGGPEYESY
ncbi:GntR family transcriptional regulator [Petrocella atlantisensis]|uniref:GntR family transcriptional regulator n=1 Tax=Petrocella atlantisensis TaxID=2173034 RepID=A0A3P7NVQ0_9FIRM|nr:GntR family transcriptional regulator [Petrocella atlantisensis]MCF8019446.1 GntR family transcriptional regulator [Vallitaleaceae bacterium]VDN46975.1 GntR family transcriptional regulator [Petrocella atlantisensis]